VSEVWHMSAEKSSSSSQTASNSTELLTPEQLAKKLNISRRCLGNWTRSRVVPMVKIGRVCRFDFAKVKAALEKFEQVEITR
jgi:excisionase family DNA binding protein